MEEQCQQLNQNRRWHRGRAVGLRQAIAPDDPVLGTVKHGLHATERCGYARPVAKLQYRPMMGMQICSHTRGGGLQSLDSAPSLSTWCVIWLQPVTAAPLLNDIWERVILAKAPISFATRSALATMFCFRAAHGLR